MDPAYIAIDAAAIGYIAGFAVAFWLGAIREAKRLRADPDYLYNPDDWEFTWNWQDRREVLDGLPRFEGEVHEFATLSKGPPVYAAWIATSYNDDGDPVHGVWHWFHRREDIPAPTTGAATIEEAA